MLRLVTQLNSAERVFCGGSVHVDRDAAIGSIGEFGGLSRTHRLVIAAGAVAAFATLAVVAGLLVLVL